MGSYKLSPIAVEDLTRIYFYGLSHFGKIQADKYYNNLFDQFERIAKNPYLFPAVDEIKNGYRKSVCGVYSIYYKIESDYVIITNIIGRQNIDSILK